MGAKSSVTKTAVDALQANGKQHFLWDNQVPGFGLRVSPAGVKSYIYQFRIGGRAGETRRTTLGRHGALTPDQARKLALDHALQVRKSVDPVDAKRAAVEAKATKKARDKELAFDAYCQNYLQKRVLPERPKSYAFVDGALRNYAVPHLSMTPLPAITKRDIVKLLDAIPATSPAVRRSVFAVLRKMFNWAKGQEDIATSPMDGMDRPQAVASRDRVMSDDELALALRACQQMGGPFGPFYELLFATGQRREEAAGLNWTEVDRANALWTLPGSRTKNGGTNLVPLNRHAIAALDRAAAAGDHAIVEYRSGERKWPAKGCAFSGSGENPVSGFSRAKTRLDAMMLAIAQRQAEESGTDPDEVTVAPWRLHDARRTLATGLQRLGVRLEVTEAVLNHTSGASRSGIVAVYQRHTWGPEKRAALDAWADHCDRVLTPADDKGNVVSIRQGG
jgi:integrase